MESNKKVIVELVGRLGNQLYTYCTAMKLKSLGYEIKYDLEYFNWWPKKRKYVWNAELNKYKIKFPLATRKEIKKYLFRTNNRYINSFLKNKKYFSKKVVWAKGDKWSRNLPKDFYLMGFEIDKNFLEKNKSKIRRELELKEVFKEMVKKILLKIKREQSVFLSVRRGDLIKFKDAHILPMDYYKKAVKIIRKNVKNPKFYISSDEISWCKKNFGWLKDKSFLEGYNAVENLEIGRNCKHLILANSTFSWWAGFLNPNKEKIVIAPKEFYYRYRDKNKKQNYFPKEWSWINEK